MLIGCITGSDLEKVETQLALAREFCDGIEWKVDFSVPDAWTEDFSVIGDEISMYHNFEETPENLEEILATLPPAPIYKLCCMANSTLDSLRMLNFVKDRPEVIGICMGPLGQITRILGPIVQNPITYAALGFEAAFGQLQAKDLVETYNFNRLTPATKIFGLIGNPIEQSPSHITHNRFFKNEGIDAVYVKMQLEEQELPEFFKLAKELGIVGLSVTIPFKEKIFDQIDHLEQEASDIGAVNTLTFKEGKIFGANTDAKGALDAIEGKERVENKRVVILGAGGSAKAIAFEAKRRGAKVTIAARRLEKAKELGFKSISLTDPFDYDILINTTPSPEPISLGHIIPRTHVMDTTVTHNKAPLILRAKALGCRITYGIEMFEQQALGQFDRWFKLVRTLSS